MMFLFVWATNEVSDYVNTTTINTVSFVSSLPFRKDTLLALASFSCHCCLLRELYSINQQLLYLFGLIITIYV